MDEFDGLVAVITGGASGIGAACGAHIAARAGRVAALDRQFTDDPAADPSGVRVVADVSEPLEAAMAEVVDRLGRIDILVNSAGISAVGTVEQAGDDEWLRCLDVNVVGIARASPAAL